MKTIIFQENFPQTVQKTQATTLTAEKFHKYVTTQKLLHLSVHLACTASPTFVNIGCFKHSIETHTTSLYYEKLFLLWELNFHSTVLVKLNLLHNGPL